MPRSRSFAATAGFALICVVALLVPVLTDDQYRLDVANRILQLLLLAMSLHLVLSTGRLNLAHISFMGIGAYVAAALTMRFGVPTVPAALVAVAVAAVVALALGLIILRLASAYFFLVTFAFLNVVVLFFHSFFEDIFGGASGLIGVPNPDPITLLGKTFTFESRRSLYELTLMVFAIGGALLMRLRYSQFGLMCDAVRQSERVAAAVGVNPLRIKTVAFVTASAIAALVGTLFAYSQKVVHYADFNIDAMLRLVVFVVVGGVGTIWGVIAGTVVLSLATELLRGLHAYEALAYGVIIVAVMLFLPDGIGGLARRLWEAR
jgi:branched-chain amino acid transport system permease protein